MRLWSLHPEYLDTKGLLALWREGLLARKVLSGKTTGYKNHPQLIRFKKFKDPVKILDCYLFAVYEESVKRGYKFDINKIKYKNSKLKIKVTKEQLSYEYNHLLKKLKKRDKNLFLKYRKNIKIKSNPIFKVINGDIENWEKVKRSKHD